MAPRRHPINPGDTHGRLTAVAASHKTARGDMLWRFRCDCGGEVTKRPILVISGNTRSCGCLRAESEKQRFIKHGHVIDRVRSPEHRLWLNIKDRCLNKNNKSFHNYGGRGVTICDEWRDDFSAFVASIGQRPGSYYSLGRIDNSKGYEPGNVRWETPKEQARNRRTNRMVSCDGRLIPLVVACEERGVNYRVARRRLDRGCSDEEALR